MSAHQSASAARDHRPSTYVLILRVSSYDVAPHLEEAPHHGLVPEEAVVRPLGRTALAAPSSRLVLPPLPLERIGEVPRVREPDLARVEAEGDELEQVRLERGRVDERRV